MTDAASFLVIILSIFLAFFLLLATVLTIILIKISQKINHITASVETTTKQFENVASTVSKVASPALIAKFVLQQVRDATRSDKKK